MANEVDKFSSSESSSLVNNHLINTASLDTILAKTENIAKRLTEIVSYSRSGQYVGIVADRKGFEILKELEFVDLKKSDDEALLHGGYERGYYDVNDFVKRSTDSQAAVYTFCFNRVAQKIEGTRGYVRKWDDASLKWKYKSVKRKYPIDFHWTSADHDADVEEFVRATLKVRKGSSVKPTYVRRFCLGHTLGTLEAIEKGLLRSSNLKRPYASFGDVLYGISTGKKL